MKSLKPLEELSVDELRQLLAAILNEIQDRKETTMSIELPRNPLRALMQRRKAQPEVAVDTVDRASDDAPDDPGQRIYPIRTPKPGHVALRRLRKKQKRRRAA
jgi:hypothetical protein